MQIRNLLPHNFQKPLWGNRQKWGKVIDYSDRDWITWEDTYTTFYSENQRAGIGKYVNEAGYKVMSELDICSSKVLEIGAGDIQHLKYIKGNPDEYIIADVSEEMLQIAKEKLHLNDFKVRPVLLERGDSLPIPSNSLDVVISFYALEHLHPLNQYLKDLYRVLKPGGILIGAIPAEGGLAWGLGRALTSRRWFKKNTNIDPDKIICWEHPNFSDEIITCLKNFFPTLSIEYWPLKFVPHSDPNLLVKFKCEKL